MLGYSKQPYILTLNSEVLELPTIQQRQEEDMELHEENQRYRCTLGSGKSMWDRVSF